MSRIAKLEIQGFRAFGAKRQTLVFSSGLAAVWGANSQGKTSLAEAIEFLLTGQIVRRALMASGQDEFADALRNAHIAGDVPTFVEAEFVLPDGTARKVRRTLKADYGKKQDCELILEIDGKAAPESALQTLGIGLSQPPLRAPVLAQHTLGYLFLARPQERATYFKALLEVGDLEIFRGEVASLKDGLDTDGHPLARKLETAAAVASAAPDLKPLLAKPVDGFAVRNALSAAMANVIASGGGAPPDSYEERLAAIGSLLAEKRALTFPMKAFERKTLPSWTAPPEEQFAKLERYIAERAKIDEETRRLTNLFREALAIPDVKDASDPLECPLCASPESLTPARIAYIAQKLAETDDFRKAEGAARAALMQIESALGSFETGLAAALPLFLSNPSRTRRARGFRVASIRVLLGTEREENVRDWLRAARGLMRAYSAAARLASQLKALAAGHAADLDKFSDAAALKTGVLGIAEAAEAVARALGCYDPAQEVIVTPLAAQVDAASKTTGWQELIEIASDREGLRQALIERRDWARMVFHVANVRRSAAKEHFGRISSQKTRRTALAERRRVALAACRGQAAVFPARAR